MITNSITQENNLFKDIEDYQIYFPITTIIISNMSKNDPEFLISRIDIFKTLAFDLLLWILVSSFIILALILFFPSLTII